MTRGQAGGIAVRDKHGEGHLRRIAREGGHTTVSRYGVGFMKAIGSAGGMTTAARRKARLYRDGVSLEVTC
jgi:hypothetical protein